MHSKSEDCGVPACSAPHGATHHARRCRWLMAGCCCSALIAVPAHAGVYAGAQENGEDNRIVYAGAQVIRGERFYELFAAQLEYRYVDGGEVRAEQRIVTPAVGLRWQDGWGLTAAIGPTFVSREEEGARTEDNDSVGLTIKGSVFSAPGPLTRELLASFTTIDRILWGRARILRTVASHFSFGAEFVGMSGEQAHSYGAGLVLGISGRPGRLGFAFGYERSTNREHTPYAGIELSAFF